MSQFSEFGPNSGFIEELYRLYKTDPTLVEANWRAFFDSYSNRTTQLKNGHVQAIAFEETPRSVLVPDQAGLLQRVYRMISAYRGRGHFHADINPLNKGIVPLPDVEDIDIDFYHFTQDELNTEVNCSGFQGKERMLLSELISELNKVYCNSIGFEFTHLVSQEERQWLQENIEKRFTEGYRLTNPQKIRRLQKILDAELFEAELHKKYIGHKRFSLEGGETVIPMLDTLLEHAEEHEVHEVLLGMAHRGRLNVLVNTVGKPLDEIFTEFEDQSVYSSLGSGDVKYHLGFESTYISPTGHELTLRLAPNPSHLEFVDPVVEGMCRALQDSRYTRDRNSAIPVLLHGDAAFIGQGVVPETLNLSRVNGYRTGGTIHVVINNQLGFTTTPDESRSSIYCTDMAKGVQAPVLHVNCEDVEGACWATKLALEFRMRYQRDVVLDLYCYRKYGHNEGDDPSFTQPLTYSEIRNKKPISSIYAEQLLSEDAINEGQIDSHKDFFKERFSSAYVESEANEIGEVCDVLGKLREPIPETGVDFEVLLDIADHLVNYPGDFVPHPKLHRILEKRVETLKNARGIDWGFAEALAFGSLVKEGCSVRLSGQDCARGTFSQRHLGLTHYETNEKFNPFGNLSDSASFEVWNSTLSEAAVVGFEFGFASIVQNWLVLWEGQFGDFANGAQVAIDQFIASSEQKWNQTAGVILLLPHGYEGQGPEHSSARLERYLSLCADDNMIVSNPTSAAQYFHLLRRQGRLTIKRPMVIMTPKSLLRSTEASASISDLTSGKFHPIIREGLCDNRSPRTIIFSCGKIYYDLMSKLSETERTDVEVVRIEQLYPFPTDEIGQIVDELKAVQHFWIQEEPQNMGAWTHSEPYFRTKLGINLQYFGRNASASTATGSLKRHLEEQDFIVDSLIDAL